MLKRLIEVGVGGITIKPGDHVCAFYRGATGRDEIFIPYVARGLQEGEFATRYPQIWMCFYDLERFSGEIIVDVLKTHPKVLINNMVVENPYYVEPAKFLARQQTVV